MTDERIALAERLEADASIGVALGDVHRAARLLRESVEREAELTTLSEHLGKSAGTAFDRGFRRGVEAALAACEKIAGELSGWRTSHSKHREGMFDGADDCIYAIRALIPEQPHEDSSKSQKSS